MGCDIHATLEKKHFWNFETAYAGESGKHYDWVSAGYPFEHGSSRNYALFSVLGQCGRNPKGQVSISENRGFPTISYENTPETFFASVSDEFKAYHEQWGVDAHSPGYATLRELREYDPDENGMPEDWLPCLVPVFGDLIRRMGRVAAEYDGDPDAVRIVFFFDN